MSSLIGNSGGGGGAAAAAAATSTSTSTTGVNNESGSMNVDFPENERLRITAGGLSEEGDRNSSGGSRWPRQETMALLKIRSDMDVIFRDSTLKGPLWEEVSRKLADLGYHRNAKKCKEKFENVYKYHKRTKDGRSTKQDGKTYRFFDQLEALENQFPSSSSSSLPADIKTQASSLPAATLMAPTDPIIITNSSQPTTITTAIPIPSKLPNISTTEFMTTSPSTSSSMFSLGGEDSEGTPTQNKKRKLTIFFENLMKEVIQKQETLQKEFLEAIEKYEHQRMVREEQWKMQELARINREHEILIQERSIAAAKDAAVIAFLQKMSSSSTSQQPTPSNNNNQIIPVPLQEPEKIDDNPPPIIRPSSDNNNNNGNKDENSFLPRISSSRWPKVEIEALIKMRTDLEAKYQDNGPKGPLWEEVSTGMKKLGYNRNAKRCKEKWENINKYYKKVKESNKKRPEDSKTCPYFDQLEELYKQKNNRRAILHNNSSSEPQQQTPEKGQEQEQDLDDIDGDEDEGEDGYEVAVHKTSMGTAAD
ncbi:hypothetical protein C5167_001299 [Papaver somniferum]|uniref:Myb-like domain-containing protein n=1 Tax=Papaver somniferum TaxID=3469 RepID=A0A4Y7KYY9_PAPSO|nr:trihelix transcription factor GT-2-like [Papaver somniferum]RZC77145.1 hypothetical protein C5167_001299 [Papaver somniferum]